MTRRKVIYITDEPRRHRHDDRHGGVPRSPTKGKFMFRILETSSKPLLAGALALTALIPLSGAQAQNFDVLYAFPLNGNNGIDPVAGVTMDSAGNLYGTTREGGTPDHGMVFKLAPNGTETTLYTFTGGTDGGGPESGLVIDKKGNLYGTTQDNGVNQAGTIFKVAPNGTETVLYAFCSQPNCADGENPVAGLIADKEGNLYGTTTFGGAGPGENGYGTVFKLAPNGVETTLYTFSGGSDGAYPAAALIADRKGNLYGTTAYGGNEGGFNGYGVVFKVAATGGETVLYTFSGGNDGGRPWGGLVADKQGDLYGTTAGGGANLWGTVFKVTPGGTETVLHTFANGTDGAQPFAGLIRDKAGDLFGTTLTGGGNNCVNAEGCGTIFEIAADGTESVLYAFADGSDGAFPYGGLMLKKGELYGTASTGSSSSGTVFKLTK
jgi:uncharacterized repeat protein (TIGR03803 family)